MVHVVDFDQPVGDRQLQLVHPEPVRFVLRREAQPGTEEMENGRGLGDDLSAGDEVRHRERGLLQC